MDTRGTVLVVDDDPAVRRLLVASIERPVVTAARVAEALQHLRDQPFEIVISDLRLGDPDGDGIAVLRAARELQPCARRWLVTGCADERSEQAVATGLAEGVVLKPWTLSEIRVAVP
jgi:CheY-like chemotaxis protein